MALSILAIVVGLMLLMWIADKFLAGAAAVAKNLGLLTLLVGMIVVGFGTSAPELSVSALSAINGNPRIALGSAYGSNITNIALVLGLTALISHVLIQPSLLKKELPVLIGFTFLALFHLYDGDISCIEGMIEMALLIIAFTWIVMSRGNVVIDNEELPVAQSAGLVLVMRVLNFIGIKL